MKLPYFMAAGSKLPLEITQLIATPEELSAGQVRGRISPYCNGSDGAPISYRALCVEHVMDTKPSYPYPKTVALIIHGFRTLDNCHQCGHELVGRVALKGKRYRGFSSSELFELEGETRRFLGCAIIYPCMDQEKGKK